MNAKERPSRSNWEDHAHRLVGPVIALAVIVSLGGCFLSRGGQAESSSEEGSAQAGAESPEAEAEAAGNVGGAETGEAESEEGVRSEGEATWWRGARPALAGDLEGLERLQARLSGDVEGWVLVFGDAALYSAASQQAEQGRLAERPEQWRVSHEVSLIPARVLAREGDFVSIQTLTRSEAGLHCDGGSLPIFERYRLRAFVARGDLSPVVAEGASQRFADGTRVGALGGVPIRMSVEGPLLRLERGRFEVVLPEVGVAGEGEDEHLDELAAPLPVALSYQSPGREAGGQGGVEPLDMALADVDWLVNGKPVHVAHSGWVGVDVLEYGPHWDGESGTLVTAAGECWSLTMRTDHPDPAISSTHGIGRLGARPSSAGPVWKTPEGATAFWPDGVEAGETLTEVVHREEGQEVEPQPGMRLRCFSPVGTLRVCHREEDLSR